MLVVLVVVLYVSRTEVRWPGKLCVVTNVLVLVNGLLGVGLVRASTVCRWLWVVVSLVGACLTIFAFSMVVDVRFRV